MSKLQSHQTSRTIAREVRMRRQVSKGAIVLLEGATDVRRFRRFFDESVSMISCDGRSKVVGAIEELYDDGCEGVLGFVDSDFDRLNGIELNHEGICQSEFHDFDMDVVHSPALEKYLNEVADLHKLTVAGGCVGTTNCVFQLVKPISVLKYLNEKRNLRYKLSSIRLHEVVSDGQVELEKLINTVSQNSFASLEAKAELKKALIDFLALDLPFLHLTSGHDFCAGLGILLQGHIGNRKIIQTIQGEVEMHLRLAFDSADFKNSSAGKFCSKWQFDNSGFILLK